MKFRISNVEQLTASNGNAYRKATFLGEDGNKYDKISVFADSPVFDLVVDGGVVEGTIAKNTKGYNNFSPMNATPGNTGNFKGPQRAVQQKAANIDRAMERKENGINRTLDRKEDAVKISATFRDATLLTIEEARKSGLNSDGMKAAWLQWRTWLLNNFEPHNPNLTSSGDPVPFSEPEYTEADFNAF